MKESINSAAEVLKSMVNDSTWECMDPFSQFQQANGHNHPAGLVLPRWRIQTLKVSGKKEIQKMLRLDLSPMVFPDDYITSVFILTTNCNLTKPVFLQ